MNSFIGCDPQLISINEWQEWNKTLKQTDKQLVPIHMNLIDILWGQQRPPLPNNPIWKYELQFAGSTLFWFFILKIFR
jgi:Xaa-Pro aminopeptidase 2